MSYFDDASLVMIPSGYKTSKVYSVKPTDGSGDLTFSRSNDTATRVNSAGLIEKVRTNLVLQSQTFDNASWIKNAGATITANTTTAPDGTLTADTLNVATNIFSGVYQAISSSSNIYTISLFVKKGTKDFIYVFDIAAAGQGWFNLTNGTLGSIPVGYNASITSVGNGWYRISFGNKNAVTPAFFQLGLSDADGFSTPASTGTAFIWGAQAETGDIATDYIATTSAAVSVGPVANVPRLDYLNSSCPRLLLEPQRTNLLTYSENLSQWLNAGGTTTANTAVSPSGYQDADTLTGVRYQATFASNTYTLSAFAKKVDGDGTFALRFDVPSTKVAVFNLNNGTIVSTDAGYTSTITAYGNGWYRCTLTTPASTTISNAVLVSANSGVSSTYVWGAQLEAGAYATSYIPTLGAAVTRGADAASKTSASALIGTSAGTIFIDCFGRPTDNNSRILTITGGAEEFLIFMEPSATGNIGLYGTYSGLQYISIGGANDTRYKIAYAWSANNYALYVNGVAISLTQSASVYSALNRIDLNQAQSGAEKGKTVVNQFISFPVRLSNSDLAALTA